MVHSMGGCDSFAHAIHSYFLPLDWLIKELIRAAKPGALMAHDYWMLTGRCASTKGCVRWRNGCGFCPTQKNYPYACFDFSATHFRAKRRLLDVLGQQLHVVSPSEFFAQLVREALPTLDVSVIPNWIDSEFETILHDLPLIDTSIGVTAEMIRVMVIASDLSDKTKVDRGLVDQLLETRHIEIHTVGQNSPFTGVRVVNHGLIAQRKRLVETIASADVVLFTCEKDTFGLVMIEALACGVPVLAVESFAAREVLGRLGIQPVEEKQEIVRLLKNASLPACYIGVSRTTLRENVLKTFSGRLAVTEYAASYKLAATC